MHHHLLLSHTTFLDMRSNPYKAEHTSDGGLGGCLGPCDMFGSDCKMTRIIYILANSTK